MCGIAGIMDTEGTRKGYGTEMISEMLGRMAHRGPDANGVYSDQNVTLGHARLSIVDLSSSANQPFSDKSQQYVVVFNGEIYNFKEIRESITDHEFVTSGDTEVLVEAYARYGESIVERLKGMFAFAIWDRKNLSLKLFRDRLGVKPLYYYYNGEVLVFASEIRAILGSGTVSPKLSLSAVMDFLKYQSVTSSRCIIEGLREIQPGQYLEFSKGRVTVHQYWRITDKKDSDTLHVEDVKERIRDLFSQAVGRRLVSDVPIGAFLSGGIDSSAVVAVMSQWMNERPVTFSIGFKEKDFDESDYAKIVAAKYNTIHHSIVLNPESFLDELLPALDSMDTPTGDGINTYVVSKAVKKEGLTVALSGVGGDELFAGYHFFGKYYWLSKFSSLWGLSSIPRHALAYLSNDQKWRNLLRAKSTQISELYPILRQVGSTETLKKVLKIMPELDPVQDLLHNLEKDLKAFDPLSQMSIAEYLGYTSQTLLKDTDQMSMAVSLEVREPFFDHELVEYVLAVPDRMKYPRTPKQLLVDSLGDMLPKQIVHRRKQGFTFPWKHWLKTDLRQFCEKNINNICEREFVDEKELGKAWTRFLQDDPGVKWQEIWLFVILEYWLEKNGIN